MQKSQTLNVPAVSTGLNETAVRKAGFIALESVFFGSLALTYWLKGSLPLPPVWTWVLFFLATFRAARTISFNEIGKPLRESFTEEKPDSCGAGANVHPKGDGLRYVIGSLVACPICSGTWAALVLYQLYTWVPDFGIGLITVLGVAGASEMLHWLGEALEWNGRKARVFAGAVSPDEEE